MTSYDPIFDISNKTIIVTGASSGLGVTFAKFLSERKANVVIAARRLEKLEKLAAELSSKGLQTLAVACDVTKSDDVSNMFNVAEEKFGRVDVIVNNAGQIAESGAVPEKITDEMFEKSVQVNLLGLWYCCREAGQRMLSDGKGGSIINLSSVACS